MRFLAIVAFCLLVIFIPLVRSLPDARMENPEIAFLDLAPDRPSEAQDGLPTEGRLPITEVPASIRENVVRDPTPSPRPTLPPLESSAEIPEDIKPTRVTRTQVAARQPAAGPSASTGTETVESMAPEEESSAVNRPPAESIRESAAGRWRVKFASDATMLDLLQRGRIEFFIHSSGLVVSVRRAADGSFEFEKVVRLEVDTQTYQMTEPSVPAGILSSFRQSLANFAAPDWEFFVKLSDSIDRNLSSFMKSNEPGVVLIESDEGVVYEN
jgi:hypothetical protein